MSQIVRLNATGAMHQLETGCYVDGSHTSALDFNLRVVAKARELGMELKPEEVTFLDQAEDTADPNGDVYEHSLELADAAEFWLNQHTEHGFTWHVEEQSLFLADSAELEGYLDGRASE